MMCGVSEAVDIICGRITFDRILLYEEDICFRKALKVSFCDLWSAQQLMRSCGLRTGEVCHPSMQVAGTRSRMRPKEQFRVAGQNTLWWTSQRSEPTWMAMRAP